MVESFSDIFDPVLLRRRFALAVVQLVPCSLVAGGVLEVVHEIGGALDAGVGELADLLAVEPVPPAAVELLVEVEDELGVDEVDEGVSDVAGVEVVDGQVEEVDLHFVILAELLVEHFFGVLVGDVADHEGGPAVGLYLDRSGVTLSGMILY